MFYKFIKCYSKIIKKHKNIKRGSFMNSGIKNIIIINFFNVSCVYEKLTHVLCFGMILKGQLFIFM